MKRLSFVPLLMIVLVLVIVAPVSAAPPVVETFDLEEDSPVFETSPCAFEVRNYEQFTIRQTSYFDKDGNLVRVKLHISGTDRVYNADNPEIALTGSFAGNAEVDLETGDVVFASGVPWHITAPGYGTVLVRAGRWLRYPDLHSSGKDSFLIPTDIAQLCEALSVPPSTVMQAGVEVNEPQSLLYLPTVIGNTQQ